MGQRSAAVTAAAAAAAPAAATAAEPTAETEAGTTIKPPKKQLPNLQEKQPYVDKWIRQ